MRLWLLLLPFILFFLGVGMNLLELSVNAGMMPVVMPLSWLADHPSQPGDILDDVHMVIAKWNHLKFLCDWIQTGEMVCSPGDCFLWLGDWLQIPCIAAWLALLWKDCHNVDAPLRVV
jgi:hypothetical protein